MLHWFLILWLGLFGIVADFSTPQGPSTSGATGTPGSTGVEHPTTGAQTGLPPPKELETPRFIHRDSQDDP